MPTSSGKVTHSTSTVSISDASTRAQKPTYSTASAGMRALKEEGWSVGIFARHGTEVHELRDHGSSRGVPEQRNGSGDHDRFHDPGVDAGRYPSQYRPGEKGPRGGEQAHQQADPGELEVQCSEPAEERLLGQPHDHRD